VNEVVQGHRRQITHEDVYVVTENSLRVHMNTGALGGFKN